MIHFSSLASGTPKRSSPPGPSSRSYTVTVCPWRFSSAATASPAGPEPTTPDRAAAALVGRVGLDPALLEAARDDRQLDLLDRDRVVVDVEHAGRLAGRRADQPGELGEVVGGVQVDRAPRASGRCRPGRSSRGSCCRAGSPPGRTGTPQSMQRPPWSRSDLLVRQREVLAVVAHALVRIALLEADPLEAQEAAGSPIRRGPRASPRCVRLLGQRALVVVRHHLHEARQLAVPVVQHPLGDGRAGAVGVLLDPAAQLAAPRRRRSRRSRPARCCSASGSRRPRRARRRCRRSCPRRS